MLAVISLLCVLAVIQHRWLGEIAEAERRKLGEEAAEKAKDIAQDIDRELTRAFLELRIDSKAFPGSLGPGAASAYAAQLARFRAESTHSGLVAGVFVAERPDSGPSRLYRFDESVGAFTAEPWPAVLAPVQTAIEASIDIPLALPVALPSSFPPVMADVPALLSPMIDVVISERKGNRPSPRVREIREMFMRHQGRGPVQIVLLDPVYLRDTLVGGLLRARLGPAGPFVWSVIRHADGSVVAGESVGSAGSKDTADAEAPLLRLRFDELDRSLLRGALPDLSGLVSESSVRLVVQMSGPSGATHVNRSGLPTAPWTLRLRHQEGSIDAAVRGQQVRNTVLSASILGVLGLSAGLVFFSALRLRALATRQVEFVAAVSHELRTPLAVIRSAADNLADGVVQERDQTRRYGALIRDESVRLTDMVEHVLEFAGADSPGRAARAPIDVAEAARAAVKGMESLAAERGAVIEVEIAPDLPRVKGDLSHLTRAISNLLGNALKYGGDAPRVALRVSRAAMGVEIAVSDRGAGLTPAEIPRLFEPFYRGQRASEAQIPGSGLGLALVKRIVESHGGRVSAGNGTAGGALFTIGLPGA